MAIFVMKKEKRKERIMEVKDVFELRKQGRIEEAYNAIRPMYATHKGHYTTIAMFWVGVDMMRLRYQQRRLDEAYKIFLSLLRLYPAMEDREKRGQAVLMRAAIFVFDHNTSFSMLDFITKWGMEKLPEEDWKMMESNGHLVQSLGLRIVSRVFKEVEGEPTVEMALKAAPILAVALKHSPYNTNNQCHKATIYTIMGKKDKAVNIYRHLISKHHRSYLYAKLAELVDDDKLKIALLTRAVTTQREEKFRQHIRFSLASLLFNGNKPQAKHELDKCIATRKQKGYTITWEMQNLIESLKDVVATTDMEQKAFYRQQEEIVKAYVKQY